MATKPPSITVPALQPDVGAVFRAFLLMRADEALDDLKAALIAASPEEEAEIHSQLATVLNIRANVIADRTVH